MNKTAPTLLSLMYKLFHPNVKDADIPYWYRRSFFQQIVHTMRKFICQVWAPNSSITAIRIGLYRLCGFKIGKGTFIGMKCYLDDLCIDKIEIGNNVTISYGVYFACHGPLQSHNRLIIKDGVYIGMRASIIARNDLIIEENAIVGAMTLVNTSVPTNSVYVGIPGKVIKEISTND